jgi:transposase
MSFCRIASACLLFLGCRDAASPRTLLLTIDKSWIVSSSPALAGQEAIESLRAEHRRNVAAAGIKALSAPISPRHAALLVTRPADQITDQQQQLLHRLARQCPAIIDLRKLALGFRAALAADDVNQLRGWIDRARHGKFGPLMRFVYGPQKDISAVAAAITTSSSSGQVQGQINRLKTIRRQMYGRAGFELLRARVLPYSPAATAGSAP